MRILYRGVTGDDVGYIHQRLLEAGYPIARVELEGQTFGVSTENAAIAFQSSQGLTADGVVGPKTLERIERPLMGGKFTAPGWRCELSKVRAAVRPVIAAALQDLARPTYEEPNGSNDGPRLRKYGIGIGKSGKHYPWCGYSCSHWYSHAEGGSPFGVKASAYKLREWARQHGRLLDPDEDLEPGDVGTVVTPSFQGHVALLVNVYGAELSTIEGNSRNAVRGLVRGPSDFEWARPLPS
jgi:peptidoglycan hydrolase-like protein with peptidoglycan-binding domain